MDKKIELVWKGKWFRSYHDFIQQDWWHIHLVIFSLLVIITFPFCDYFPQTEFMILYIAENLDLFTMQTSVYKTSITYSFDNPPPCLAMQRSAGGTTIRQRRLSDSVWIRATVKTVNPQSRFRWTI